MFTPDYFEPAIVFDRFTVLDTTPATIVQVVVRQVRPVVVVARAEQGNKTPKTHLYLGTPFYIKREIAFPLNKPS